MSRRGERIASISVLTAMPLVAITMIIFGYGAVHNGLVAQPIKELVLLCGTVILLMWVLLVYAYLFRRPVPEQETKR